jgi:hypothetical protein
VHTANPLLYVSGICVLCFFMLVHPNPFRSFKGCFFGKKRNADLSEDFPIKLPLKVTSIVLLMSSEVSCYVEYV